MGLFDGKSRAEREYEKAVRAYDDSVRKRGRAKTQKDTKLARRVIATSKTLGPRRAEAVYAQYLSDGPRPSRRELKQWRKEVERLDAEWRRNNPGHR